MTRYHVRKNASTGESETVAFTSEEEAAADALALSTLYRPLNRIQFEFMVEKLGISAAVQGAIEAMPDGDAKILARVLFRSGQEFIRSHPLFTTLAPAVGFSSEQIDAAWLQAMAV